MKPSLFPHLAGLALIVSFLISACTKEQAPVFVIPSSYRFNTPSLESKTVYVIDPVSGNVRIAKDTLGSFNRSNQEIADSLNRIITTDFAATMLARIDFQTGDKALFVFGRLDTTMLVNKVIVTDSVSTSYALTGNRIAFAAFPEYYININYDFLELHLCRQFTYRSQIVPSGSSVRYYVKEECSDKFPNEVISDIISSAAPIKYDTISLEYVNYIFSRY